MTIDSETHRDAEKSRPETFRRRVLLSVTGLSPQVVTETLYALSQQPRVFVPTEVHIVTTVQGAEHARLNLLSDEPGWFHRLCTEYALGKIAFDAGRIHVLRDAAGHPLEDIRSKEDNERAADHLAEIVRMLTSDEHCALHVSIAGGRKTMGYYVGYALSLFGRAQDRLSHVLVSAPFESHPQFYYPSRTERVIHTLDRQQVALDCSKARVELADIPFVRLREGLPERLIEGKSQFSEVVAAANRAHAEPRLILNVAKRLVTADGEVVQMGATEFAFLLWLAVRAREDEAEVNWTEPQAASEFLETAKRVLNPSSGEYERLEQAVTWRVASPKDLAAYFEPQKSRVNSAFAAALGEQRARLYQIYRVGARGASRYLLPFAPEAIDIHDHGDRSE